MESREYDKFFRRSPNIAVILAALVVGGAALINIHNNDYRINEQIKVKKVEYEQIIKKLDDVDSIPADEQRYAAQEISAKADSVLAEISGLESRLILFYRPRVVEER